MKSVLYPGSFDPITFGHIDVVNRLSLHFDRVVVLVANSVRKNYMFTINERVELIQHVFRDQKNVEVKPSDELTVNFAKKESISLIARSVRTVSDWEYEYSLADANKKLDPKIETLFIMANPEHAFISSSLVREIALFGGDTTKFVPANVAQALKMKGKK